MSSRLLRSSSLRGHLQPALVVLALGVLMPGLAAAQPTPPAFTRDWVRIISQPSPPTAGGTIARHHLPASLAIDLAELDDVRQTVPLRFHDQDVRHLDRQSAARVVGTNPALLQAAGLTIQRGRFLTERDQQRRLNVCVLSTKTAQRLFGPSDPLGREVFLNGGFYTVVGLFESSTPTERDVQLNRPLFNVCLPLTTMRSRSSDLIVQRRRGTFEVTHVELHELWLQLNDNVPSDEFSRSLRIFLESQIPADSFRIMAP